MNNKRQLLRKRIVFFSFLFFPFTIFYLSPYLIIKASIYGILCGSMALFSIQFITSLILGRAFCGWICPGSGIHLFCGTITSKKAKNGKLRYVKYFIFVPWLLTIIALILRAGGIQTIDILYMTNISMPMLTIEGYIVYFGIVLLFVILSLTLGTRAFCHMLCWMAPFMVIGTKIKEKLNYPSLRLFAHPDKCTGCTLCTKKCPMGLEVMQMIRANNIINSECILCGECVDSCRFNAITIGWGRKTTAQNNNDN